MSLSTVLIIIALVVIALVLILFPESRVLLKGITRVFIKDMATTPEGAEAIYAEKINMAEESYNKADNALKNQAGKLSNSKRELENLKSRLTKVSSECEALVKSNRMEAAVIKSEEREEIVADIERTEKLVVAYTKAVATAKEMHEMCEKSLKTLKKESREVVENMRTKSELKKVYDDMDELKSTTATDKLLASIREKNNDLDASVEGAKVVYDNRLSTKIEKADVEARKAHSNEYLESLKKKYNK